MKLLMALGALFLSSIISAAPLHKVVIFGDSLSDNGNLYEFMKHQLPQSPPYYNGRFSNGPVWVEQLIASYFPNSAAEHLLDYAVGGAGVSEVDEEDDVLFTLNKQIKTYFLSHQDKANADDLYVVWIGANNYLGLPEETDKALSEVNTGIVHSVQQLIDKGARHLLLVNLPNLGQTPAAVEFDAADTMSYFSTQHNTRLRAAFSELKKNNSSVEWLYFDLNALFSDVTNHPGKYGFTNVTNTCSNTTVDGSSKKSLLKMVARVTPNADNGACEGYLFFDLVHPTSFAHRLIAQKVRALLDDSHVKFAE